LLTSIFVLLSLIEMSERERKVEEELLSILSLTRMFNPYIVVSDNPVAADYHSRFNAFIKAMGIYGFYPKIPVERLEEIVIKAIEAKSIKEIKEIAKKLKLTIEINLITTLADRLIMATHLFPMDREWMEGVFEDVGDKGVVLLKYQQSERVYESNLKFKLRKKEKGISFEKALISLFEERRRYFEKLLEEMEKKGKSVAIYTRQGILLGDENLPSTTQLAFSNLPIPIADGLFGQYEVIHREDLRELLENPEKAIKGLDNAITPVVIEPKNGRCAILPSIDTVIEKNLIYTFASEEGRKVDNTKEVDNTNKAKRMMRRR
jgi:hypothetical protein